MGSVLWKLDNLVVKREKRGPGPTYAVKGQPEILMANRAARREGAIEMDIPGRPVASQAETESPRRLEDDAGIDGAEQRSS